MAASDQTSAANASLAATLHEWLALADHRQARRFLLMHPELLGAAVAPMLASLIQQAADQPALQYDLRLRAAALQDAWQRGGDAAGIDAAFLNLYGSFALDVPDWLDDICAQDATLQQQEQGRSQPMTLRRTTLWEHAREQAQSAGLAPQITAEITIRCSDVLAASSGIDRAERIETAIEALRQSEAVYTREHVPLQWARIQINLGIAYRNRIHGQSADNLELAIAASEAALEVFTSDAYPYHWAQAQSKLGVAYSRRIYGEQANNLERAIVAYEAALTILSFAAFPLDFAKTQGDLGLAYWSRIHGERAENVERAIVAYEAALLVFSPSTFSYYWALAQNNLGLAYFNRIHGERAENVERAIVLYEAALQILKQETFPYHWALVLNNLGNAYHARMQGDRAENLERAIAAIAATLQVFTDKDFPDDWANTQNNLGEYYLARVQGERAENLERAIAAFAAALHIYTPAAFPDDWAMIQNNLGEAYAAQVTGAHEQHRSRAVEAFAAALTVYTRDTFPAKRRNTLRKLADQLAYLGRWTEAAENWAEAVAIETDLFVLAAGAEGRDAILREGEHVTEYHAYALTRLGRLDDAAVAIEMSRSRSLAEARRFDRADPQRIRDPARRQRYAAALASLLTAQTTLQKPGLPDQHAAYLTAVTAYREARTHFDDTVNEIHAACDPADFIQQTITPTDLFAATAALAGGHTIVYLLASPWGGVALGVQAGNPTQQTGDRFFAQDLPDLTTTLLDDLLAAELSERERERLAGQIDFDSLHSEIQGSLATLARVVMRPMAPRLQLEGAQSVTIIPCGALGLFPLLAAPITTDEQCWQTLGDHLPASTAPSILALAHTDPTSTQRSGISTIGNPLPTPHPLEWGEAEALTLAHLAGDRQRACVRIGYAATRAWLIEAAGHASILDVACHGLASGSNFLQYQILLANGEAVTLADILSKVVDLQGMRLLILSACQTSRVSRNGAYNEMRSLAVGMLQAGTAAVLAALWPVDDRATYLLMVRFAQEWFPTRDWEPPAAALARAQRWLREVTWSELQQWVARELLPVITTDATLSKQVTDVASEMHTLAMAQPRHQRLGISRAEMLIREQARKAQPGDRPFAHPYYWAAFHITGW